MLVPTASPAMCFAAGTCAVFVFSLYCVFRDLYFFPTPGLLLRLINKIWDRAVWKHVPEKNLLGCGETVARLLHSIVEYLTEDVSLPPLLYSPPCLHLAVLIVRSLSCPHFSHVRSGTSWLNISSGISCCRVAGGGTKGDRFSGENQAYHEKLQRSTTA